MGIYVYNVRKSNNVRASFEGREVVVHALTYTCKHCDLPTETWDKKYAFPYDAMIARMEMAWGGTRPEFIAIPSDKKFEDGLTVYRWTGGLEWVDCNDLPGEAVGILRKQGRGWVLESHEEAKSRGEKLIGVLRNGPWPVNLWGQTLGCSQPFAVAVVELLAKEKLVEIYRQKYEGDGETKPHWHNEKAARLGAAGMNRFDRILVAQ
jgi:hypothetical protein